MDTTELLATSAATQERKSMTNASQFKKMKTEYSGIASTAVGVDSLESFLENRKIEIEIALRYGLKELKGAIEFPFIDNGNVIYKKYRGIKEKSFYAESGHKPFPWNIDCLRDESLKHLPVIITEGELDALTAIQCGYSKTISVPNGAGSSSLEYLDEYMALFANCNEIILAVDTDPKGYELSNRLSLALGKAKCKWVKYPKGCKDLNDALMAYGEKGVKESIKKADWVAVDGVFKMGDLQPVPYKRPYDIGIAGFEDYLKIRMGDFSVWTGVPSSGKSTFLNDVSCRLVSKHGFKPVFASFEQLPQTDHKRFLRTWHSAKLEKNMTQDEKDSADKWIDENFLFIVNTNDDFANLEWLLEKCAVAVVRHGANFIVIDPWNEIDHDRPNNMSLTEYTGFAIKQFKAFAKKYDVHVAVVAHPAKMLRAKDGKYPIPTLYDISDSAHWYNKADLGVVVHRDKDNGDIVMVAKSRYHNEIGKTGVVDVKFSVEDGRYTVVDNSVLFGND